MKIILKEKFKGVSEFWHPYIVGELNDNLIQIVKLKGKYIWHKHGDEMFVAIFWSITYRFEKWSYDKTSPGEILIIPTGFEHFTRTY